MEIKIPKKKYESQLISALIVGLALMWVGFGLAVYQTRTNDQLAQLKQQDAKKKEEQRQFLTKQDRQKKYFDALAIQAKSYVVYDLITNEIIAEREATKVLPLASITKVMTALAMTEELGPEAEVIIKSTSSDNKAGLTIGERWQLANLSALTLVVSSNDGAAALAEAGTSTSDSIALMNKKAERLGLKSFYFTNPTGLDEEGSIGGRGTAEDVAKLFAYIMNRQPDILRPTKEEAIVRKSNNINHTVLNTNKIIKSLPGPVLASKTGYTDIAGGNLAIVVNLGLQRPVAIVVLGSSQEGRFSDTEKLAKATLNYYAHLN